MRSKTVLGLTVVLFGLTFSAGAQPPSPDAPLSMNPLGGGVYWVKGGVGNTGFIVGDKGLIAIDAQFFVSAARNEIAQIAKLTPKPIDTVVITHSDPDHVNGLPAFPSGAEIIAQENAKVEMLQALTGPHPAFSRPPPELKDHLPTRTVRNREELVRDGVRLVLLHTASAHTDGDLIVYLPSQKIVFAGDLLTPAVGPYPGIHLEKHGSSQGWIKSIRAMLALDADVFVAGHGEPQTRAEVETRLRSAIARRARIKALVDQGKSLDDIKHALNDRPLTGALARFPTFTETTYQELVSR